MHSSQLLAFVRFHYARMCTYALYFWCRASCALLHFPFASLSRIPTLFFRLICSVVSSFVRSSLDCLCTRLFGHLLYMFFHEIDTLHTQCTHTQYFSISLSFTLHSFFPSSSPPPLPLALLIRSGYIHSAVSHHPIRQIYPMNMYALVVLPFMLAHKLSLIFARFVCTSYLNGEYPFIGKIIKFSSIQMLNEMGILLELIFEK